MRVRCSENTTASDETIERARTRTEGGERNAVRRGLNQVDSWKGLHV